MSRTVKNRAQAYDNIAVGQAITTRERVIVGALPPDPTVWGNGENIQSGVDYGPELVIGGSTTLMPRENL